ncbi:MAG: DegV family protein [Clostridia bacterium]|nr:DegV family protein [Clostridia bacterium]
MSYVILTDSACDLSPEVLSSFGVAIKSLTFRFTDSDKEYSNDEMPVSEFYEQMRQKRVARTAAVNTEIFCEFFASYLKEGNDVLYLGFSSGLSNTYNAARLAAEQLAAEYPERKILTVDTLCASAGQGLLVKLAVDRKNAGKTIEEVAAYVADTRLHICHWFTVDDLDYLKRGGRVSPLVAMAGNLLGIKPVLHVDNEGHLIKVGTARGRRGSLLSIAQKYDELAIDPAAGTVYISHADCRADAELLAKMLKDRHGVEVEIITDVGTVIGAHSGPGTLALFFLGKER